MSSHVPSSSAAGRGRSSLVKPHMHARLLGFTSTHTHICGSLKDQHGPCLSKTPTQILGPLIQFMVISLPLTSQPTLMLTSKQTHAHTDSSHWYPSVVGPLKYQHGPSVHLIPLLGAWDCYSPASPA